MAPRNIYQVYITGIRVTVRGWHTQRKLRRRWEHLVEHFSWTHGSEFAPSPLTIKSAWKYIRGSVLYFHACDSVVQW